MEREKKKYPNCGRKREIENEGQSSSVVVAQLVERSLPIPEIRGSNPVIGKHLYLY